MVLKHNSFCAVNTTRDFLSRWNTANTSAGSSASNQIHLPLVSNGVYSFVVYWGDGLSDRILAYNQVEATHTYLASGIYDIRIAGRCTGWAFQNTGDRLKLLNISQWGSFFKLGNKDSHFYGCSNLTITAKDSPDLSDTTTLYCSFRDCTAFNANIIGWDFRSINSMSLTFFGCTSLNQPIRGRNAFNITDLAYLLYGCTSYNQSLVGLDMSAVSTLSHTFYECTSYNQSLVGVDTPVLINMWNTFYGCTSYNQSLVGMNSSQVSSMYGTLEGCTSYNQSLVGLNMLQVYTTHNMLYGCTSYNQSLAGLDTPLLTDAWAMLYGCTSFNQPLVGWNAPLLQDASYLLQNCYAFNQPLVGWTTSQVQSMYRLLYNVSGFKQSLAGMNVTSVTNANGMITADINSPNSADNQVNYDATLNDWASQDIHSGWVVEFGTSKYSAVGQIGHDILTGTYGLTIIDGGLA